jgi:hypothetical protein
MQKRYYHSLLCMHLTVVFLFIHSFIQKLLKCHYHSLFLFGLIQFISGSSLCSYRRRKIYTKYSPQRSKKQWCYCSSGRVCGFNLPSFISSLFLIFLLIIILKHVSFSGMGHQRLNIARNDYQTALMLSVSRMHELCSKGAPIINN